MSSLWESLKTKIIKFLLKRLSPKSNQTPKVCIMSAKNLKNVFKDAGKKQIEKTIEQKPVKGKAKIAKVMHEFKAGTLNSGSKKGPKVKKRSQAIAIALNSKKK